MNPSRPQRVIEEEASLWYARRRMLGADEFDQQGFDAWLAAHESHGAAYARMEAAATAVDALKDANVLPPSLKRRRFRAWLAPAAGLAAAAAILLFAFVALRPPPALTYATEIAEVETFTLADGSLVTLGPLSQLEVRLSPDARQIDLRAGEAFFDVAHDVERPLSVRAGAARVVVVGTQFDVRRTSGVVRVAVARGAVTVEPAAPLMLGEAAQARLRAGDQAELPARVRPFSSPPAPVVSQLSPGSAGAWRDGHLSYVEAPLSELIADLNRYYAPGIRLSDPAAGRFRLTASFRVQDLDTFLSTLPEAAPVTLTRASDGEITIAAAD